MGVQSMVPHVLAALGRTHDPASVHCAVDAAHSLDLDLNLDLIYGVAGESMADWERTLDEAITLDPDHLSAYALTVEPGTPLAADPARHPDDDDQADKYRVADERLGGVRLVRDIELGEARPRVPPQPPLLVAGRVPRHRLRGPLAPGRPPLVEPPHP
jgi:oxygen-independent coproporphyrinogen-3 oxidase